MQTLLVYLYFLSRMMIIRVGEYHQSFKTAPSSCLGLLKFPYQEKLQENAGKRPPVGFKVFQLPTALPQGQFAEVPLYFRFFTTKVVGQRV